MFRLASFLVGIGAIGALYSQQDQLDTVLDGAPRLAMTLLWPSLFAWSSLAVLASLVGALIPKGELRPAGLVAMIAVAALSPIFGPNERPLVWILAAGLLSAVRGPPQIRGAVASVHLFSGILAVAVYAALLPTFSGWQLRNELPFFGLFALPVSLGFLHLAVMRELKLALQVFAASCAAGVAVSALILWASLGAHTSVSLRALGAEIPQTDSYGYEPLRRCLRPSAPCAPIRYVLASGQTPISPEPGTGYVFRTSDGYRIAAVVLGEIVETSRALQPVSRFGAPPPPHCSHDLGSIDPADGWTVADLVEICAKYGYCSPQIRRAP